MKSAVPAYAEAASAGRYPVGVPRAACALQAGDGGPDHRHGAARCRNFAWLNGLRQAHFPPDRNRLDAHLTLFHHLPPSLEPELEGRLATLALSPPPSATADGLINLGRGVAVRIVSPQLEAIREDLARSFAALLTPQDAAGWRPHVTIQNKVRPEEARALLASLSHEAVARRLRIVGLAAWWYRGGPWELLSEHPFRGR